MIVFMDSNQSMEAAYFMVNYRDMPNTDFLCEYGGDVRLKVSKVDKTDLLSLSGEYLCAIVESCILVFENIGNSVGSKDDIFKAIFWYKKRNGFKTMFILKRP